MTDTSIEKFRNEIIGSGLLSASHVEGVYGRSATYEEVATDLIRLFRRLAVDEVEDNFDFPAIMPRKSFEQTGYLSSFPNLMGSVHSFYGDERQHSELVGLAKAGEQWEGLLEPTEVMMCSAACHNLYPGLPSVLPLGGRRAQVSSWCFRHEPSRSLTRMQAFRMIEYVCVGEVAETVEFRDRWMERGRSTLVDLGLDIDIVPANDPFFGRRGRLPAQSQLNEELKFELVTVFDPSEPPVAIASSNLHQDHFGRIFGISTASGKIAHSTCFAWGLDRIVLALFNRHGTDPAQWPAALRTQLSP